jgi:hypothetical protein
MAKAKDRRRIPHDVVGVRRWRVRRGLPTARPELGNYSKGSLRAIPCGPELRHPSMRSRAIKQCSSERRIRNRLSLPMNARIHNGRQGLSG